MSPRRIKLNSGLLCALLKSGLRVDRECDQDCKRYGAKDRTDLTFHCCPPALSEQLRYTGARITTPIGTARAFFPPMRALRTDCRPPSKIATPSVPGSDFGKVRRQMMLVAFICSASAGVRSGPARHHKSLAGLARAPRFGRHVPCADSLCARELAHSAQMLASRAVAALACARQDAFGY